MLILLVVALVRPIFSVPYERDPNFIDRKEIFTQIEERLRRGHRASLCGIGGVGYSLSSAPSQSR